MTPGRAGVLTLATLIAVAGCAGCTGSRHRAKAVAGSTPATAAAIPAPEPVTTPTSVPTFKQYAVPASVANDAAKRKQARIDSCATTAQGATATGTVHNTGSDSATYNITVFFTSATATAVDYATAAVTVAAGGTTSFTAQRTFEAPAHVLCVLVGVN